MSYGGAAAGFVGLVLALKRRQILRTFRVVGALTETTAQSREALGISDSRLFRRLVRRGVLRALPAGTYFLDVVAEVRDQRRRRRIVAALLLVLVAGMALMLWIEPSGR
jgi:hypothetical protein